MKSYQPFILVVAVSLFFQNLSFGQAPNLGITVDFVLFSAAGAIGNTGISQVTGNVGTNVGAISTFGNVNGVVHNADATTIQCTADLLVAYNQLDTATATFIHGPVLGNGDTLTAGVYSLSAAGSLVSVLTLDAQGDSNAVFIFKFGGAFTSAASSTVNLINGASACNVFWKAEGAIALAASTTMRGALIAHNGAISMGAGCTLEGRALSTAGAVTIYGTLAYTPPGCGSRYINPPPSAPLLGTTECYALFSSVGAVSNADVTNVSGHIGTNIGLTTGYDPALVTGMIHPIPDSSTAQCSRDLLNVFSFLYTQTYDIELLYPVLFGNDLVLTPHTYRMNAAAALTGALYLNAEGNADAVFIVQVIGALSTSANSKVWLLNGAQAKNVFWMVEGAVTINDYSTFCGTIVCHNGAIVLNTGVMLDGRALTTTGAVTTLASTVDKPLGGTCSILPVELMSFTGVCDKQNILLKWSTASEDNNKYYTIQRSKDGINWQVVDTVSGAGNSSAVKNYTFIDKQPYPAVSYYRLRQTDFDGKSKYFKIIVVKNCMENITELNIYPNPASGTINLFFNGAKNQVASVLVYNESGEIIYKSGRFESTINLAGKPNGIYFLQFQSSSSIVSKKFVIKK
jgi:hypothetical protein